MRKDVQDEAEALLSCADNGLAALKTSIIAAVAAAIAAPLAAAAIAAAHAVPALAAGALAALSSGLMSQSPKRALPTTEAAGGGGAGAFDSYFDDAANPRLQPALQRFLGLREGEARFGVGPLRGQAPPRQRRDAAGAVDRAMALRRPTLLGSGALVAESRAWQRAHAKLSRRSGRGFFSAPGRVETLDLPYMGGGGLARVPA